MDLSGKPLLPHPESLLPICKQRVSVPHRQLTLYRPLSSSSRSSSSPSLLLRLLDSIYSWSRGLHHTHQALEKVKRDRDRAKHQWAEDRIERETLDDEGRIKYRSFLSRALFWLTGLGGPVFSPPLSALDVKVDWLPSYALEPGFDLIVRGYESWQDERVKTMMVVLGTSLPEGHTLALNADQVTKEIRLLVRQSQSSSASAANC